MAIEKKVFDISVKKIVTDMVTGEKSFSYVPIQEGVKAWNEQTAIMIAARLNGYHSKCDFLATERVSETN